MQNIFKDKKLTVCTNRSLTCFFFFFLPGTDGVVKVAVTGVTTALATAA